MPSVDIEISNRLGLHARAASKLTQLASTFKSEIFISKGSQRVNAKSIMGVMLLAAGKGMTVTMDAEGEDADAALVALKALFDSRFGEPD
ncbi:phosphocarrier protein HPr [Pelistega indica]|uniref:Phosphocarrier protein HPr n=1 Tax=Pelistega indica TaxID=1414851 RepID=V8G0G0_9BURK|nr:MULTISPECIES: HPr family phosphocarrier protein [Pelistega]ETD69177.1 phosphocarrier protein HPr [Pelistega indica]